LFAQQIALRGSARRLSIAMQVLDGPPGFTARRLSSFLLIPVGINRQGFAFLRSAERRDFRRFCVDQSNHVHHLQNSIRNASGYRWGSAKRKLIYLIDLSSLTVS
jgi:hypothetical protein